MVEKKGHWVPGKRGPYGPQKGTSNVAIDAVLTAMKPGQRVSKSGNIYWEYRAGHSDKNPKKKL